MHYAHCVHNILARVVKYIYMASSVMHVFSFLPFYLHTRKACNKNEEVFITRKKYFFLLCEKDDGKKENTVWKNRRKKKKNNDGIVGMFQYLCHDGCLLKCYVPSQWIKTVGKVGYLWPKCVYYAAKSCWR